MKFNRFIWLPRILIILFALFCFYVSFHVFGWSGSSLHKIKEFVIYNIPTIVLLLILWFSRKYALWCGILLIIMGFVLTLLYHTYRHNFSFQSAHQIYNFLIRSVLPALAGLLLIITQFLPRKVVEKKEPAK
jgi:hypothetical protein